ncbi:MAG: hypothetical protein WAM09_00930 [Anaerolineales bacterium]|jgi:hypothetical protein
MDNKKVFNKRLSAIGWGLLLIWWGLRWSVMISLPEGSGLLGTSLIFLGANVVRKSAGFPANSDNTFIGLFSLLSGGILFTMAILRLPYQPPVFETMLIALGVLLLGYALLGTRKSTLSES